MYTLKNHVLLLPCFGVPDEVKHMDTKTSNKLDFLPRHGRWVDRVICPGDQAR